MYGPADLTGRDDPASAPGWTAAAVFLGWAVGNRRAFVAEIQDRADRAERTREEQARHAVDTERLRIARELHDVVAHTMSMISMQAGVAAHVIDTHPDKAADSLQIIHTASKQGLRELRAILGVLRQVDTADTSAPTPGLAHLGALIESTRAAGLPITVSLDDGLGSLPAVIDIAAYRIVQEALTNTLRHAGPTTVTGTIEQRNGQLRVQVDDPDPATPPAGPLTAHQPDRPGGLDRSDQEGSGQGITGMRERAAALGGTLHAAPRPAGGFRVLAWLPLTPSRREVDPTGESR